MRVHTYRSTDARAHCTLGMTHRQRTSDSCCLADMAANSQWRTTCRDLMSYARGRVSSADGVAVG